MTYFDNAATTYPVYTRSQFGVLGSWMNSNTPYATYAKKSLIDSSNTIKNCLHVNDGIVLYFRCATEAIEWLSKFVPDRFSCLDCETTAHDSVYNLRNYIAENDGKPGIWVETLVNPVTGNTLPNDMREDLLDELSSSHYNVYVGCDYTAAVGHIPLPEKHDYDFIYFSGHKFGTEKGIGAMWIGKELCEYLNVTADSNNQYDLVHGTVDVEGAAMLAFAMQIACTEQRIKIQNDRYKEFISTVFMNLKENGIDCEVIPDCGRSEPCYAINAVITPFNADALATYLASKDIYVGVGHSACSGLADYRVLENMGYGDVADKVIRISFGPRNTMLDVQNFCEEVIKFKELF